MASFGFVSRTWLLTPNAECVIWLSHIGLERYRNAFFHNHVTGKTLENMTSEKLRSEKRCLFLHFCCQSAKD